MRRPTTTSGLRSRRTHLAQTDGRGANFSGEHSAFCSPSVFENEIGRLTRFEFRYFTKFERFVPHEDFAKVDKALRGADGPVEGGSTTSARFCFIFKPYACSWLSWVFLQLLPPVRLRMRAPRHRAHTGFEHVERHARSDESRSF